MLKLYLGRIEPARNIFSQRTRKTSITSPAKNFSNYVNRTCINSSPLLQTPHIVPTNPILSVSTSIRKMSDQSNIPENLEDLKCGNLFDVKGFVAVVTGVSPFN